MSQGPVGRFSAQIRPAWYPGQQRIQQEAEVGALACTLRLFPLKISGSQTPRPLPIIPQCPPVHPPPRIKLVCVTSAPSLQLSQTWEVSPEGGEGAEQCEGVRGLCLTL